MALAEPAQRQRCPYGASTFGGQARSQQQQRALLLLVDVILEPAKSSRNNNAGKANFTFRHDIQFSGTAWGQAAIAATTTATIEPALVAIRLSSISITFRHLGETFN